MVARAGDFGIFSRNFDRFLKAEPAACGELRCFLVYLLDSSCIGHIALRKIRLKACPACSLDKAGKLVYCTLIKGNAQVADFGDLGGVVLNDMAAVNENIVPVLDIDVGKVEILILILGFNAAVIVVKRLFKVIGIDKSTVSTAEDDLGF